MKKLEEMKKHIEKSGYYADLIDYKNNKSKIKFTCPKGHSFLMSWNSFSNGRRCRKCSYRKRGEMRRKLPNNIDEFKNNCLKYTLPELCQIYDVGQTTIIRWKRNYNFQGIKWGIEPKWYV